jgi:type I restriction enzyme S subunit
MSSQSPTLSAQKDAAITLIPKLRFPEFWGEEGWLQETGDYLFDQINERNHEQGLPVLAITQEYGAIPRHLIDYHVSVTEKSIESYKVVRVGDFIISLRSFQGGIEYSQFNGICSPAYVILRRRVEGSNEYFKHYLKTDKFIQILTKNLEGLRDGKMISYSQFSELILPTPTPLEQQKIANCITSLDDLITAQARKVDALKTHKKGLMQQLFPREGETQPRLRFPEFREAGEWMESKLISLSNESLSNGVFNDPKKVGSGYKLINVSDMYIETTIDENRLSLLELSPSEFAGNQVLNGDIFFTRSSLVKSGIAVSNIYLGSSSDVTYEGHLIRFRVNTSKVVPLFAHYLFKTALIRTQLIARGKTATMTTIGQADVSSVTLFYPDPDEQQRIASCLSSLDALITTETQKLAALKTHKKGLMQQLFPSPEEAEQ